MAFMKDRPNYDNPAAVRHFEREPERADGYDAAMVDRLRERVVEAFGARVRRVILFGSRARGDALPESDYDVLVVFTELVPEEWLRTVLALYDAFSGIGVAVEPHPMSELEFEETKGVIGGLAYPAATEGVILYENA
jgi:predicted nucleotidyltransferase